MFVGIFTLGPVWALFPPTAYLVIDIGGHILLYSWLNWHLSLALSLLALLLAMLTIPAVVIEQERQRMADCIADIDCQLVVLETDNQ